MNSTSSIPNKPSSSSVENKAIICDIDGTLAIKGDRSPYDWGNVGKDKVNETIRNIVNTYYGLGSSIIIMTGRDGICEDETKKWLDDNHIVYDEFFIRKHKDNRSDEIVKKEFYQIIKDKYDIQFVLDDRNRVVKMWRELGLTCLQVAEGDF